MRQKPEFWGRAGPSVPSTPVASTLLSLPKGHACPAGIQVKGPICKWVAVFSQLAMPDFSATLLGLMGISSGTYIGFKIPDAPK
jgi:hypothetical protein